MSHLCKVIFQKNYPKKKQNPNAEAKSIFDVKMFPRDLIVSQSLVTTWI